MSHNFITFKKFNDAALAEDLVVLLKQNGIEYTVEEDVFSFDPAFRFNNDTAKDYLVKIKPEDFTAAEEIINKKEQHEVEGAPADHYLYDFTNDELTDVIAKADEWSNFDQVLARKILTERGVIVNDQTIATLKNKRLEELSQPAKPQNTLVALGFICAILGGIVSVVIGWHLSNAKRTLPNGRQVYAYNDSDRKTGRVIFYLGLAVFIILVILKLLGLRE